MIMAQLTKNMCLRTGKQHREENFVWKEEITEV